MSFLMPKIPPAPSPKDIAAAQDKIRAERESKELLVEQRMKQNDAANNLTKSLKKKRGRGTLITRRGGSSYMGITDDALGPRTSRTLLGNVGSGY